MNKVLGITAIICAVLIVIGVGILFIGKALGGTDNFSFEVINNNKPWQIRDRVHQYTQHLKRPLPTYRQRKTLATSGARTSMPSKTKKLDTTTTFRESISTSS